MTGVRLVLLVALALGARGVAADGTGTVRFYQVANTRFDRFTANPDAAAQAWMRAHYWRMLTYAPYFDARLAWFPDAWAYKDLYAIDVGSPVAVEHPDWLLRDRSGRPLYIPYACGGGRCPQYAADPGNADFRAAWIADARARIAKGYRGLFVDDVNLLLSRVSDGSGQPVAPVDPRTGTDMIEADWRRYLAELTEQIRAALPDAELVHNVIWYAGQDDPFVARELLSASYVNLERGVNDAGLRGGTVPFGFDRLLTLIDWLHGHGVPILLEGQGASVRARTYSLAAYFLLNAGADGLAHDRGGSPSHWWSGFELSLGDARGPRYGWQGLLRRDFAGGTVLLNPPGAATVVVTPDAGCVDVRGRPRRLLTLAAAQGAVLRCPGAMGG